MASQCKYDRIRVLVGKPWPEDFEVYDDQPSLDKKSPKIRVLVGKPWPEDIRTDDNTGFILRAKIGILLGFSVLVAFLLLIFAAYGWFFSEEVLKLVIRHTQYLSFAILIWSVGPQVRDKVVDIAKAMSKMDTG